MAKCLSYGLSLTEDGKKFKKTPLHIKALLSITEQTTPFGGYINNDKIKNKNYQDTYNSALFLDSFGKLSQSYGKRFFVPFGEEIPFIGQFQWVQNFF